MAIGGPTLSSITGLGYFRDQWEALSAIVWRVSIIMLNRPTKKLQLNEILFSGQVG